MAVKMKSVIPKNIKNSLPIIIFTALGVTVLTFFAIYFIGKAYYSGKFPSNTSINGIDVSAMTLKEAQSEISAAAAPKYLKVDTISGKNIKIKTADFDLSSNSDEEVSRLFEKAERGSWFSGFFKKSNYAFDISITYDEKKLRELIKSADWGDKQTRNAEIVLGDDGYFISAEIQGDAVTDMDRLAEFIDGKVSEGIFNIVLDEKTGCYTVPDIKTEDLREKCGRLNKIYDLSVVYDFTYTTETLEGEKLLDMIALNDDGSYTANREKCMEYVEYLAEKYDTYNTERKFHATLQGDITVPTSEDAKYGWWIDHEKTCDRLVDIIENGEGVQQTEPVYFESWGYTYTGMKSARTADDDIGDTYIEIDLTSQHLWFYKDGEIIHDCYIVSGQTTSEARTTLPGVYKVWYKSTNYRLQGSNEDGDSWDTYCNYWIRVAIAGIGLHDSEKRGSAFGGSIYKYNGSHGCINLPYDSAKYIYENVEMDTPVVMYY